jgi:hypothetical protein
MSGVILQRERRCKMQNCASQIFLQQSVLLSTVKKSFWTCLTEEIARLGFAPVSSAELERIWVCLL